LVIDPGYRTLDWLTVENMVPDMRDSGSYDGGVSEILRELSKMIGTKTGLGQLDFDLIERGLKKGSIKLAHKDVAMQEFQAKIPSLAKKEVGAFLNRIPSRNQISRVILTGGGADYYKEAIAELMPDKDLMVQSDPVMGNVRGFWLVGCDYLSD
jgi:plasmid segregation protein ParM